MKSPKKVQRLLPSDGAAYEAFIKQAIEEDSSAFRRNIEYWRTITLFQLQKILASKFMLGVFEEKSIIASGALNILSAGEDLHEPSHAQITNIHVLLGKRRLGYGAAILEALIKDAVESPYIATLTLDVDIDNEEAIGLYESRGFQRNGFRKDVDALRMFYPLPKRH